MLNTIYALRNTINSKVYIGQTWQSLHDRFDNSRGYGKCLYLGRAIEKYGKENFYYETLMFCGTQETADYWEIFFIEKYESCNKNKGYNLRYGGSKGRHTDSTKKKLSEATKNNPVKMFGASNPMFGKHKDHPMFGKVQTEEAKQKMSAAKLGKPSPNKGKTMSDNARHKMSIAKLGSELANKKIGSELAKIIVEEYNQGNITQNSLAEKYVVSQSTISSIIIKSKAKP
jgi:group I intron endonuclease